jgi:hypothetical protein
MKFTTSTTFTGGSHAMTCLRANFRPKRGEIRPKFARKNPANPGLFALSPLSPTGMTGSTIPPTTAGPAFRQALPLPSPAFRTVRVNVFLWE